ncbi:helix-hairpin-helix domain-containing protein [Sphingobacterium paludis]|uniref:DNA uptake protein ComE-like DNA-binding protein n=1 Tax=Sphingobacterium paludis TaxID=1476465 RepID=A0A4V3E192_9SPHI|nr:helix-hairpin-helix domain-containing protein [Sphingobacterium paludis]TDS12398.1 DNA uptake protein ComE-like DNA-binding protein [Sphingobacterium paludis]
MKKLSAFFRLTHNERRGFLVLLLLVVLVYYTPFLYRYLFYNANPAEPLISWVDADPQGLSISPSEDLQRPEQGRDVASKSFTLTPFNPNNLPDSQWRAMGFSDKQIRVIKNYESKGGRFYKAEDVRKMYSISAAEFQRIAPFLRFDVLDAPQRPAASSSPPKATVARTVVDINSADSAALVALPGIGPVLSTRMIKYRNSLGGFHSLQQLQEVYGLPAETLEKLKGLLSVGGNGVQQLAVNLATETELAAHPYISKRHASRIIRYRGQHGPFTSLEDLAQIYTLDSVFLRKIEPYLKFN